MADSLSDLPRSARPTRGKRMSSLLDDEAEADEMFWGQDAFQEDAQDIEYEADEEVADEFDSDFDEDEPESEDEAPDKEERSPRKKKLLPPGQKFSKEKRKVLTPKKRDLSFIESAAAAAIDLVDSKPKSPLITSTKQSELSNDVHESFADLEVERAVRKSTRTAVIVRQAERDALRAALPAINRPVKKKKEGEERRITQEEMLLEAAQTEIINRQNLEKMLAREEEVKQKAIVHKTTYSGPQIRFHSKNGRNVLEFMRADPGGLFGRTKPCYPKRPVCVVTGLPAKYVDPLTGLPYATKEAFNKIRERLTMEESSSRWGSSGVSWKRARTDKFSSGHGGVARQRQKVAHRLQAHYSPQTCPTDFASMVPPKEMPVNLMVSEQASYVDISGEAKIRDQPADYRLSAPLPTTPGSAPERHAAVTVESTFQNNLVLQRVFDEISVPIYTNDTSLKYSTNLQLALAIPGPREEANEADFILDDLDVGLSLELDSTPPLQHNFVRPALEILPLDAGIQLPIDVLHMEDFGGLGDLL